jgi:hypothetical protein
MICIYKNNKTTYLDWDTWKIKVVLGDQKWLRYR